ncbi:ImuA family protein [Telmatospirillum siberiense]|uniref:ImuA family protein n=1 Tax=Telmatospirillum siberiense TaxID=382514 RepID=UPI0018ECA147|nr:damage-inducible mutagenesis protein [Telmatospirillum siberiense]
MSSIPVRSPETLAQLRRRIAALEAPEGQENHAVLPFGVAEIDGVLPWGGLPLGALHEIAATGGLDDGAALGFTALLLGRLACRQDKPVLWVGDRDDLYAPGLASLGLPSSRLLMARPGRGLHPHWAMEEGARCRALAGVVGEVWDLDGTAARRLQIAARASGVPVLALNRGAGNAVALTRWRIAGAPSAFPDDEGGGCRWSVTLSYCRGRGVTDDGIVSSWLVEWSDETHRLRLAAVPGDRTAPPKGRRAAG